MDHIYKDYTATVCRMKLNWIEININLYLDYDWFPRS